jgi:hypothetical protein
MFVGNDATAFLEELRKWMSNCVTSRTVNPQSGQAYRRELDLMQDAFPDIQAIFDYAKQRLSTSFNRPNMAAILRPMRPALNEYDLRSLVYTLLTFGFAKAAGV